MQTTTTDYTSYQRRDLNGRPKIMNKIKINTCTDRQKVLDIGDAIYIIVLLPV